MNGVMVVGLFGSKGDADNARHRLVSEGVAEDAIAEHVLSETASPPHSMDAELSTLQADPFFWFMGNLRQDYARYIHNGETAVLVRVPSRLKAEAITALLGMFDPLRVDVHDEPVRTS